MSVWRSIGRALGVWKPIVGLSASGMAGFYPDLRELLAGLGMTFLPVLSVPVAVFVFALLILTVLFAKRLQHLESSLEPKISLSVGLQEGYKVSIDAKYTGDNCAEDAKLVLWSVEDEDGNLVHEIRESLQILKTGNESTPLRSGEPKGFLVAKIPRALYESDNLQLGYVARLDRQQRDQNDLDRGLKSGVYYLNMRAVSTNTPATMERFRLSYTDDGLKLKLSKLGK